jgi:glyoxylase-like metal-dependent hydrolase (beta-lactamase superfamily II)
VAYVLGRLAAFPFPEVLEHLRYAGGHRPDRPTRMEFHRGIYLLPLLSPTLPPATHTNCVIVGERELVAIDPGAHNPEEIDLLKGQLDELMEQGGRLMAVLLTHSHIDHIGGAAFLRETYGAPVWAHEAAAAQLDFPVDRYLCDGEVVRVAGDPDWRLRCLHTPGHDPGHLCYLEETTRTLIAGDMMANPGTIVIAKGLGGDMTLFIESLERLIGEGYDLILPGHGMPMSRGREKVRKHLEHRLWREAKIKAALDAGASRIEELLEKAYDDTPKEAWPFAEQSLRAHLDRLGVHEP